MVADMKYMMIIFLSFILCCGPIAKAAVPDGQQKAARESLQLLKKLPLPYIKKLGFKSEWMVKKSFLGNPLEVDIIGIGSLKIYEANRDPKEVLEDANQVVYPVYVSEMPVSSITIIERNGKWAFAVFGGKENLFAEQARLKHSGSSPDPQLSYFMVQVQAMYITFLAFDLDGVLYFIPTAEHPLLKYPLYVPVPASKVLMELKRIVEKYENAPVDSIIDSIKYSNVSVIISADKLHLKSGETTKITVTVKGLDRLKGGVPVPLHLENKTPGIVSMGGGNIQTHIIRLEDIKPGGIYSMTRILTGKIPGNFRVSARIYSELEQFAERLASSTGMKYRNKLTDLQEEEILTMPKIHYITFTKKDLNIYKIGKDPSVTLEMKAWAKELLDFLNTARPKDQQWLANIYMESLIDALSK
jgi:hypothetical protein